MGEWVDLTDLVVKRELYPSSGGGFSDIYKGVLQRDSRECQVNRICDQSLRISVSLAINQVAIKVIRSHTYNDEN